MELGIASHPGNSRRSPRTRRRLHPASFRRQAVVRSGHRKPPGRWPVARLSSLDRSSWSGREPLDPAGAIISRGFGGVRPGWAPATEPWTARDDRRTVGALQSGDVTRETPHALAVTVITERLFFPAQIDGRVSSWTPGFTALTTPTGIPSSCSAMVATACTRRAIPTW